MSNKRDFARTSYGGERSSYVRTSDICRRAILGFRILLMSHVVSGKAAAHFSDSGFDYALITRR